MARTFQELAVAPAVPGERTRRLLAFATTVVPCRRSPSGRFSGSRASRSALQPSRTLPVLQFRQIPLLQFQAFETAFFRAGGFAPPATPLSEEIPARVPPGIERPAPEHFRIRKSPLPVRARISPGLSRPGILRLPGAPAGPRALPARDPESGNATPADSPPAPACTRVARPP